MKCDNCGEGIPIKKSLSTTKVRPLRKHCPGCGETVEGTSKSLLFKS